MGMRGLTITQAGTFDVYRISPSGNQDFRARTRMVYPFLNGLKWR